MIYKNSECYWSIEVPCCDINISIDFEVTKEGIYCGGLIPWEEIDKARALIEKK